MSKNCQVCGDPLYEPIVWCRKCHTPHHEDCWYYNRWCSTYGCGERYAVSKLPVGMDTGALIHIDEETIGNGSLDLKINRQLHMSDFIKLIDFALIPARILSVFLWFIVELYAGLFYWKRKHDDEVIEQSIFFTSIKASNSCVARYSLYVCVWGALLAGILSWVKVVPSVVYILLYLLIAFVFWFYKRRVIKKKLAEKDGFS